MTTFDKSTYFVFMTSTIQSDYRLVSVRSFSNSDWVVHLTKLCETLKSNLVPRVFLWQSNVPATLIAKPEDTGNEVAEKAAKRLRSAL